MDRFVLLRLCVPRSPLDDGAFIFAALLAMTEAVRRLPINGTIVARWGELLQEKFVPDRDGQNWSA